MLTKTLINSDVDKSLLNILKTRGINDASWKLTKKRYEKLISLERLYFLRNRGSYGAYLCNMNANLMQKSLDRVLSEKGVL